MGRYFTNSKSSFVTSNYFPSTHAKQLLCFIEKIVEEMGYEVGIGGPHYFSRLFKKIGGVMPSVYRER